MKMRLALLAIAIGAAACGQGEPRIISMTADPPLVVAGSTTTVTLVLENFAVGGAHHGLTARGLRAAEEAGEGDGHIHIYLDNTDQNPLVQSSAEVVPVIIPRATPAGAHTLIGRLQGLDHAIIQPEVKATTSITVQSP